MEPKRREEDLSVRELDDELLVYDANNGKAHSLNRTAAFVFRLCDGTRNVSDLETALAAEIGLPREDAACMVEAVLEQMGRCQLLVEPITPASQDRRLTRRQVLKGLAAAMILVPMIASLATPSAALALSIGGEGWPCQTNQDCQIGFTCVKQNNQQQGVCSK